MSLLGFDAIGRWALGQLPSNGNAALAANAGAVAETGGAQRFVISARDAPGAVAFAPITASFAGVMRTANGSFTTSGGGNAFAIFEADSAGGFALALGFATVDLIGAPVAPPGPFGCVGVPSSFAVSLNPQAGPLALSGLATGFIRDFINWLPQPFATWTWQADSGPVAGWSSVAAPASDWGASPMPAAAWSELSQPSNRWTADPAQQILPPVDN